MPAGGHAPIGQMMQRLDEIERLQATSTANAFQNTVREKLSQRRRHRPASDTRES
jgi:hypothetical protein